MLLAMVGLVGVGGVGAFVVKNKKASVNGTALVAASSPLASAEPEPSLRPSAPSAVRVVSVTVVAPPDTRAELDGSPAAMHGGAVEITGAPGSLHKLRLSLGETSQETAVTVLESGAALPSSVELVVKTPAKVGAGAKDVHVAQAAPSASVPSKPKVAVPPPASAAPPSSEPAVKRTF
jgi:serine/threonine-protein kinase